MRPRTTGRGAEDARGRASSTARWPIDSGGRARTVFIYGSCVSRDTLEFLPADVLELRGYVARQSMLSTYRPARLVRVETGSLSSAFQRKMIEGSLKGDALARIAEAARGLDLLLIDIVDERLGVYALPDGTYVTRTVETEAHDLYASTLPEGSVHLPFGSDRHFEAWAEAAKHVATTIKSIGLGHCTYLLPARWAEVTDTGVRTPSSFRLRARDANALSVRYHKHLLSLGLTPLTFPRRPLADAKHRWGIAPFHYTPDVYAHVGKQLVRAAAAVLSDDR